MKRIAFCLLWVFLALPLHAQEYDYYAGGGAACGDLAAQQISGAGNRNLAQNETTYQIYTSSSFTATATGAVKSVTVWIKDAATPSVALRMWLCGYDGTAPDATTSTAMDKCTQSATEPGLPGGSYVPVKYSFDGYSVTSGHQYYVVLAPANAAIDATNYYTAKYNSTTATENMDHSQDASTWNSIDTSAQFDLIVSSCE